MDEPTTTVKIAVGKMMARVSGQSLITDAECCNSIMYNRDKCRARVRIYVNKRPGGKLVPMFQKPAAGKNDVPLAPKIRYR